MSMVSLSKSVSIIFLNYFLDKYKMDEKPIMSKSQPISIISNKSLQQYSLNNMKFDPTQNSPPSLWKMRLNKRVGDSPIKNVVNNVQKVPLLI
jgi:hypothetical protein